MDSSHDWCERHKLYHVCSDAVDKMTVSEIEKAIDKIRQRIDFLIEVKAELG